MSIDETSAHFAQDKPFMISFKLLGGFIADTIRTSAIMKAGMRMALLPVVGISYLSLTIGVVPSLIVLFFLAAVAWLGLRSLYRVRRNCLN
jgi:hypothetical protein